MIRNVRETDVAAITEIYNHYVVASTASFEELPLAEGEMKSRIASVASGFPYIVWEDADGTVTGYAYAHPWKERVAYRNTLETTVYVAQGSLRQGIGRKLMERLIEECRQGGFHALIACITTGNEASIELHRRLGFRVVSSFEEVGRKFGAWLGVTDMELLL